MKVCGRCNANCNDSARFCSKCGASFQDDAQKKQDKDSGSFSDNNSTEKTGKTRKTSAIFAWIFSVLFAIYFFMFFPSWSCLFSLLALALLLPPLKPLRDRYLKKGIRIGALVIACLLFVMTAPKLAENEPAVQKTTAQQEMRFSEQQPDTVPEISPQTEVEPTVTPTHESTSAPTTEPAATPMPTAMPTAVPATATSAPTNTPEPTIPPDSSFTVHFIDVGQADAILVQCDGHSMLVDGGNKDDSQLVVSYLKKQKATNLDYVINTHPHEDHVGGLAGVMHACTVQHAYASVVNDDSYVFQDFKKYVEKAGLEIEPLQAGAEWNLGSATVSVLSAGSESYAGNNASIVLKITYFDTSFLLMGDAEDELEKVLLSSGYDLKATVIKVGHHGDDKSTGYQFLREVMPDYAVISVGTENTYGHPTEAVLSRLHDAGATIFRTDLNGNIVMKSDGKSVNVDVENEVPQADILTVLPIASSASADEEDTRSVPTEEPSSTGSYIGNRKTKKFHKPSCSTLPDEGNRVYFDSRDEAKDSGYVPCKRCKP